MINPWVHNQEIFMEEKFAIPGVGGIIRKQIESEEFILVQDRFKEEYKDSEAILEIPAGKIREYENIYTCLKREVFEETGLVVQSIEGEKDSVILKANNYEVLSYTPFSSCQNLSGHYPIMVQVFLCSVKDEELKIRESNESKNIRWISKSDLRTLLNEPHNFFPMHISTLKKYCDID